MTATKPRIPIDFSAISTLHCPRRYQWTCVTGYDTSNEHAAFGSAVHIMLEQIAKGTLTIANTMDVVMATGNRFQLPPPSIGKLVLIASQFLTSESIPAPARLATGAPAVEFKFAFDWLETDEFIFVLCGTIDLVTVTSAGYVMLEDYKTSNHCRDLDKVEAGYLASVQLPIYMFALRHLAHLFDGPTQVAIDTGLMGRYRMIYHNFTPPKVRYTSPVAAWADADLTALLVPMAERMYRVWRTAPDLWPPEGRAVGACQKLSCPFSDACLAPDEHYRTGILASFKRRAYNPLEFR